MRKIGHIGIPTTVSQPGEVYNEGMKVYLTDPSQSINKIEYLRFDKDSWLPELIQTTAHIAYEVDSLEEEIKGKKVLLPITKCNDTLSIAFIEEDGIAIELMEIAK